MVGCLTDELSGRLGRGSDGRGNECLFYYVAYSGHGRMDSALVVCRFGVLVGGVTGALTNWPCHEPASGTKEHLVVNADGPGGRAHHRAHTDE